MLVAGFFHFKQVICPLINDGISVTSYVTNSKYNKAFSLYQMKYIGRVILFAVLTLCSLSAFSQQISQFPSSYDDSTCTGDTAFLSINFINSDNANSLTIDSIEIPSGFVRKQTYPVVIPTADTTLLEFFHPAPSTGTFGDSIKIYSNATNQSYGYSLFTRLKINPKPNTSFSINDTDQCLDVNSFVVTNATTISSGTITYEWFFGDATQAFVENPTKVFTSADTFDFTLIAKSDRGCNALQAEKVIVFPAPVADIENNNTFTCFKNHKIDFVDSTKISDGTYTVKWFFGTGDSSEQNDTSYVYPKDSTFRVKLIATSNRGCIGIDSQDITINPTPTVDFSVNDSAQCFDVNSYDFTDNSSISSGSISSHSWSFGDATNSSDASPTGKTYTTAGIKTVRLIVTSDLNCNDTFSKQISVQQSPIAGFSTNDSTQCRIDNIFSFTNSSTIGGTDTMFYNWEFGDGMVNNSDTDAVHTYAADGNYTVKLVVTSNYGCKDSITRSTDVYPHPQASFTINDSAQCLNNQNYIFTNGSSISSGTIDGYSWRFGNGDTTSVTSPTKNDYSVHDSLTVMLIARSNQNCYDTARKEVIIFPLPQIQFNIPDTVLCFDNHSFTFDDNSTIAYGTLSYQWQFGNGATSAAADTTYSYPSYATLYQIGLNVFSDQGCVSTGTDSVYLYQNPDADFIILDSAKCLKGNSFSFFDNSTIPSGTFTQFWEFGDGDTSTQTNPNHSYNVSDTLEVELTVTSDLGCTDSIIKQTIVFPQPQTQYLVDDVEQCFDGHVFNFKDTTSITYGTLTYSWDFGDGTSSNAQTPVKNYTTADTFDITYTVTSDQGCDSTSIGQVFVNPSPTNVGFATNDTIQCLDNNQFVYTNSTALSAGTMFYTWSLGNGSTVGSRDATITYLATDTLTVKMVITTDKNCTDSAIQVVYIHPNPTVSFNVNDPIQCFGDNTFDLTNVSNIPYGTLAYNWDLDDGTTSTQTSIFGHSFASADTFTIALKATSNLGCADSITRDVRVDPDPVADFVINDDAQCINGNSFQFTDNTFILSGNINYSWNFGDNNGGSSQNPSHTYTKADTFTVTLITTSDLSCKDTVTKQVIVTDSPDPSFAGLNSQFCINGAAVTLTPVQPGGTFSGDNITADQFSPVQPGWNYITYRITLNGCSDSLTDSTQVVPVPVVDLGLDTVLCKEDFYTLNVFTQGATYLWSDSSTQSFFRITDPGIHWVRVTNACGTFSDSVDVNFLDFACDAFMPNAFTPEGNTVNDYFFPTIDTTIVKGIQFIVFSRWGNVIFETKDRFSLGWDGFQNGLPAPEGVYGYLLNLTLIREDTRVLKQIKGSFHLLR